MFDGYPLVNCYSYSKWPKHSWFTHSKWCFSRLFLMFTRVWHHVKALKPYEIPMRNLQDLSPRWIQLLLCGYLQVFARLLQCREAQCQRLWYPREGLCGGALSEIFGRSKFLGHGCHVSWSEDSMDSNPVISGEVGSRFQLCELEVNMV